MQENNNFTQNIDTVFTDLHNFIKTDTVLGTPMVVGDKTLVPLMSITLGYGSTAMGAKASTNTNATSGGMGLGAKVTTNGVIVIEKDKVQILPTNDKGMSQMMDKLPQALASVGSSMMGGQGQQQGQSQGQNQPKQG